MRQLLLPFALLLLGAQFISAQTTYHRVRVDLSRHSIQEVGALGLETDHGIIRPGAFLVNDFSEREVQLLEAAGIPYQIAIEDVGTYYQQQPQQIGFRNGDCATDDPFEDIPTPENYVDGTMGGYFTYDEMLTELERMHDLFPELITPVTPIDTFTTFEGRPIYWLRISDNAATDEPAEPKVLYTALHHAREPNSLSQLIFYMWHLLENYHSDPQVQFLLNNTAMYFIPCLNPDGYVYNEQIMPQGGGLWRKNRRPFGGNVYGVDLNRNYGFEWGFDDSGSSPDPNSQVFRGDAPFSEPETQAAKAFCELHNFKIILNYHTFGNLLIHPWGYNDVPTSEDALFKGMGNVMNRFNDFRLGTGTETVGYVVNGGSDDWMYGEMETKDKAYSYTPEVGPGTFGFWPPASAIDRLNKGVLWQNLAMVNLVHYYLEVRDETPETLSEIQGTIPMEIQRFGLEDGSATLSVTAGSSNVVVASAPQVLTLDLLESTGYSFDYLVMPGSAIIEEVRFAIALDYGGYVYRDTLEKIYLNGETNTVFADPMDSPSNWTSSGSWAPTTEAFVSAPNSFTDSPFSNYAAATTNLLTLNENLTLNEEAGKAFLRFQARWATEDDYDYAQVQLSTDAGNSWTPLCGRYTVTGNGGFQPAEPLYQGIQNEWVQEEIDLTEYLGESVSIRFLMASDNFIQLDGFYVDDLEVVTLDSITVNASDFQFTAPALRAFPNPVQEELTVQVEGTFERNNAQVILRNTLGQTVYTRTLPAGNRQTFMLDMRAQPAGLYTLQLEAGGQVLHRLKVIR